MTISTLIKRTAEAMTRANVSVHSDYERETVTISAPNRKSIFMQGKEAVMFFTETDEISDMARGVPMRDVELHVACPYVAALLN